MLRQLLDVVEPLDAACLHIVIAENKSLGLSVSNDGHSNLKICIVSEVDCHKFALDLVKRNSGKLPDIAFPKEHFIEDLLLRFEFWCLNK